MLTMVMGDVYLLTALLLWVVPNLFAAQPAIEAGRMLFWYVLPALLLALLSNRHGQVCFKLRG